MSSRVINIQVTESEISLFFQEYRLFGELQRKIVRIIHWYSKTHNCVFPSQSTIATLAGCSREHVNKTLAKMKELGWLTLISRGLKRTKVLILAPFLKFWDFSKKRNFSREEFTTEFTHNSSSGSERTLSEGTKSCVSNSSSSGPPKQPKRNVIEIPEQIAKAKISLRLKLKLSMISSSVFEYAKRVTKARIYNDEKEVVRDSHKYLLEVALKKSQENHEKLHWRSYYHTIQHYQAQGINVDE